MEHLSNIAVLIIVSAALSLVSLLLLHFASPEFKASWRMISEYALGKHKWLLTLFFIFWSISSLLTGYLILNTTTSTWSMIGSILILISGIGAFMGGIFDVKHKLHGLSFALGVPTFPIGALIIAYDLVNQPGWASHKNALLVSAHSTWISVILMVISMGLLFSGLKKAGIAMGPNQEPLSHLPESVIGINGYANRLLVVAYLVFNIVMSMVYLKL